MSLISINPFDNSIIKEYSADSAEVTDEKILRSLGAFRLWRQSGIKERIAVIRSIYDQLEQSKASAAKNMTLEMGKLYKASLAEIEKTKWLIRYYMENAEAFLSPIHVETQHPKSYVSF